MHNFHSEELYPDVFPQIFLFSLAFNSHCLISTSFLTPLMSPPIAINRFSWVRVNFFYVSSLSSTFRYCFLRFTGRIKKLYFHQIYNGKWNGIKQSEEKKHFPPHCCIINTGRSCVVPLCTYLKIQ